MTDDEVLQLILNELTSPTMGVTEQYLKIHQPVYDEHGLKIERIDREEKGNITIAYLPVQGEYFYFAVYIDSIKKEIYNVGTESRNIVSLRVTSEELTAAELRGLTKLKVTKNWNKGDLKQNKKAAYTFSCIQITPNPEPDEFENKLGKLLNYLKTDEDGIVALKTRANAWLQINMDFHAGNQLLGSASISPECIKIMNELGLGIDFDFAAWGEQFT
ncbi:DUF4279 domain-containing protein [Mucilaginibacter sp.]|uniref:DUF4279 domain-containing protein n=1 Tax=Mucilaginibacter sp. TaxID=1882438 RepID=UPI0025DE4839|nr:DUF4279 domain-containing protein [Mucilaginibacter sp.]